MNNRLICIDVDDTILQWKKGYLQWMNKQGWFTKPEEECNVWEMSKWFLPHSKTNTVMTPELSVKYITEFNTFPRCLKPLPHVLLVMKVLKNMGYNFVAVTSFGSCPKNIEFRQDYLDVVFQGMIDKTICLDLGQCKKKTLQELKPEFFVEDNKSHAQKAIDLGITTFLLSTPYNQDCQGAIYVDSWLEIEQWLAEREEFISNEYEEEYYLSRNAS